MSLAKLLAACGLIGVVLCVSACGITAKPVAGDTHLDRSPGNHSYVNDPRYPYPKCLRRNRFKITEFSTPGTQKLKAIQIDAKPTGPTVVFEPTPGIAEGDQIKGEVTGAEVIGSALIYPNRATDKLMQKVEGCISINVKG